VNITSHWLLICLQERLLAPVQPYCYHNIISRAQSQIPLSSMVLPSSSARASSSTVYPVSVSSLHQHPNSHHACFPTSKPNHENAPKCIKSPKFPRRFLIFLPASFFLLHTPSSFAIDDVKSPSTSTIDTTITDRVYMDFSVCPSYFRSDRTLGTELSSCPDSEPLGRVVFGLYGRLLPATTANFKATCTSAAYHGTLVHKLLQGQFFAAGRQGSRREKGGVQPPSDLVRNSETVDPKAFELCHARPGTLSLCLGQNDDDDDIKLNPDYHNVEFLVTTGPGPCPELDGQNIVFGTVLEGELLQFLELQLLHRNHILFYIPVSQEILHHENIFQNILLSSEEIHKMKIYHCKGW
jgi:peptidyl-prolyl cis-trans isomerase B (cyclophilin B)